MSVVAFDYETTGFNPRNCSVFAYVLTDENGVSEVYDLDYPGKRGREALQALKAFFADVTIEKVAHNLKFELHFTLRSLGILIPENTIWHDTLIMSQMANNLEASHKLEELSSLYCTDAERRKHWTETDKRVRGQAKSRSNRYDRVDRDLMHEYQRNDGFRTMLLFKMLLPKIQPYIENYRWEIKLILATQKMEDFGLLPSKQNIEKMMSWLNSELSVLNNELFFLLNAFENFNSDEVVRAYLYEVLSLPILAETDTGKSAVDKEVFFLLLEQFPEHKDNLNKILKFRSYQKGKSMISGYLKHIDPTDNIIHHSINTNSARTGRQSAKNPNMQNVSKENALKNVFPVPARKCFVPRENSILAFVDYAGIEMRLIIEAVKEPTMIQVLKDGGDIHAVASEYWFGKMFTDQETCLQEYLPHNEELRNQLKELQTEMTSEEAEILIFKKAKKVLRSAGKNGQFALAYGADIKKIAETLMLPLDVLMPGYRAYCEKFPLIASFTRDSMSQARRNGFVTTSFGRRLFINKDRIHTASNYRIQGTAAEMLKRATVNLDLFLEKNYADIRIIVPIHDELMLHIPNRYIAQLEALTLRMGEEMTEFEELAVPIEVEWEFSEQTWNDKTNFETFNERRKKK